MTSLPETFSKLYSRMPSLYPLRFRSNFAQEMSDAFDRCLDELFEKGPIQLFIFNLVECRDLPAAALV